MWTTYSFSALRGTYAQYKRKRKTKRRRATLWGRKSNYTAADSAAVNCCETKEEEDPNPAAVNSIRKGDQQ